MTAERQAARPAGRAPIAPRPSRDAAVSALAAAGEAGRPVRFTGGGTKLGWGASAREPEVAHISTRGLDRLVEHNEGDLTAVVEAGLPLAEARRSFAEHGQELLLDPPDPGGATVGGVIAAGDSGPLRQRYGGPRDLVLGVTVALSDGNVASAGGKVIKNVAGYDLGKLLTGSLGSLGLILELSLRLHPKPPSTATAAAGSQDPDLLAGAALALGKAPLEPRSLDLRYGGGDGALLARFGGAAPRAGAEAAARHMREAGLRPAIVDDDAEIWRRQRDGQRSARGLAVRVSALPSRLGALLRWTRDRGARMVARAALGLAWVVVEERTAEELARALTSLRRELAPSPCAVVDAPADVRRRVTCWPAPAPGTLALMERVKQRFDPAGVCRPPLA